MFPQTDQGPAQDWLAINLPGSWVSTLPASLPKGQGLEPDRWALTGAPQICGYLEPISRDSVEAGSEYDQSEKGGN